MKLIVCDQGTYDDPKEVEPGKDDAYIARRLKSLFDDYGSEHFVILSDEDKQSEIEEHFIQVAFTSPYDEDDEDEYEDEDDEDDDDEYEDDYDDDEDDDDDDDEGEDDDDDEGEDDDDEKGFALLYREGSVDKHYECASVSRGPLGLFEITRAFLSYLHGTEEWKTSFDWKIADWLIADLQDEDERVRRLLEE